MGLKEIMLLVGLATISLLLNYGGAEGGRKISREDLELHRYVKRLNERAVEVVKTPEGDDINCVEINKQPALDHPLLKNHTIQMYPSSFPKGMTGKNSSTTDISSTTAKDLGCPKGTVPILRIQKEDLRRLKSLPKRIGSNASNIPGYHFAVARPEPNPNRKYHGSKVAMSVYGPAVFKEQFTEGVMWVQNGPLDQINSIQVGWAVNPALYGDSRTHLFGYWTADGYKKTGCFDIRCPGFVQVSSEKALGLTLSPVSHDQVQYETEFHVFRDPKTGNWWLAISPQDTIVGYWPNYLFTSLTTHAEDIEWGGETYNPIVGAYPTLMGSGHFVMGNNKKTSYVSRIQLVNEHDSLIEPGNIPMQIIEDNPDCYRVEYDGYINSNMRYTALFGGPRWLWTCDI